jgi:hypothetical protein
MDSDFFNRKTLEVLMDSGSVLVLGFDEALIGYSEVGESIVSVYDQDIFIEILSEDMPFADALEFFHLNFISNNLGDKKPIFIRLDRNI